MMVSAFFKPENVSITHGFDHPCYTEKSNALIAQSRFSKIFGNLLFPL